MNERQQINTNLLHILCFCHLLLASAFAIGFWHWLLTLAFGNGFWNWLLALTSGIGFWHWLLAFAFGIGFRHWLQALASGIGFWQLHFSLSSSMQRLECLALASRRIFWYWHPATGLSLSLRTCFQHQLLAKNLKSCLKPWIKSRTKTLKFQGLWSNVYKTWTVHKNVLNFQMHPVLVVSFRF